MAGGEVTSIAGRVAVAPAEALVTGAVAGGFVDEHPTANTPTSEIAIKRGKDTGQKLRNNMTNRKTRFARAEDGGLRVIIP